MLVSRREQAKDIFWREKTEYGVWRKNELVDVEKHVCIFGLNGQSSTFDFKDSPE